MGNISLESLRSIRRKAYRKRVWYTALDSLERGIVNLTIGIVESVKSLRLTKVLEAIHEKLENACLGVFDRHHKEFGLGRAVVVVDQAFGFVSLVIIVARF